jgi:hypothetical protein
MNNFIDLTYPKIDSLTMQLLNYTGPLAKTSKQASQQIHPLEANFIRPEQVYIPHVPEPQKSTKIVTGLPVPTSAT